MKSSCFKYLGIGVPKWKEEGWLHINPDGSISDYYLWVLKRHGIVVKPAPHITVVAGKYEQCKRVDLPNVVYFKYNNLETDGFYYWLNVSCDWIPTFRESVGLNKYLKFAPHLTLGRLNPRWGLKKIKRV